MIEMSRQRVLVLAPHTDDELHCAASIRTFLGMGSTVYVHAFSACEETLPVAGTLRREFKASMAVLGVEAYSIGLHTVRNFPQERQPVLDAIIRLMGSFEPTVVMMPSSTDLHQDHAIVHAEGMRACRNLGLVLGWESPWNQRTAVTNFIIGVTEADMAAKRDAFACYKSQESREEHFNPSVFYALAKVRGAQVRCRSGLAEAFELLSAGEYVGR